MSKKYYIFLILLIILVTFAVGVIVKRSYQTDLYFEAVRTESQ